MKKAPAGIKMMILDVDGVLTAGDIIVDDQGRESKKFHSRDGLGFYLLHRAGIRAALLSGRSAQAVEQRARQLKIDEVHQGAGDKLQVYERLREKYGLEHEEICYMGDDLIDLPVMKRVGFAAAPADAPPARAGSRSLRLPATPGDGEPYGRPSR